MSPKSKPVVIQDVSLRVGAPNGHWAPTQCETFNFAAPDGRLFQYCNPSQIGHGLHSADGPQGDQVVSAYKLVLLWCERTQTVDGRTINASQNGWSAGRVSQA